MAALELAIMTKVYCSEAAVATVYDCMRVVGIASYTKDLAPLERKGYPRTGKAQVTAGRAQ